MEIIQTGKGKLIQPPDINAFREWNRRKSKVLTDKRMSEAEAVTRFIKDGDYIGTELYGSVRAPMSLVSEIVRQGIKDLRVAGQGVLELDLLLAASLIKELDFTYIGLELYGVSNCLRREVESGRIKTIVEWSNAALTWRFKATSIGVPFIPTRSMLGTDTFNYSAALVVEDPFTGDPVCLVPALILDVGLIHVHRADQYGNAQIDGISGFSAELARSSKRLLISAEEIVDSEVIRQAPDRTIIPYYLVDAVVEAPFGSHPGEMCYQYRRDEPRIREWVEAAKDPQTTRAYLDQYIYGVKNHQEYLSLVGAERLENLKFGAAT
ncbi:MAG: CoA transferase subunit A [Anaerolineales bacterium]|jgi:acyl CoA:acetate/3-ketoacid CoA transferase alpha subunit